MGEPGDGNEIQELLEARKVRRLVADGHTWIVREVPPPHFDRRGGKHLMFDAETVVRRVRKYPPNWFDLSNAELYALTDQGEPKK